MVHAFNTWILENNNIVIIGVLSDYLGNQSLDETVIGFRGQICDYYVRNVISAKSCPSQFVFDIFNSFLGNVLSEEWEKYFSTPLIKMLKKSPESASKIVSHILTHVRINVSVLVKEAG